MLYGPFDEKLKILLQNCTGRGATYVLTSAYRSFEEQDKLFAQGRTKPGLKVTNARGGQSAHNYGVAADFVAKPNGRVSWDIGAYAILQEEAEKIGLESGASWRFKDAPHVQLPLLHHSLTFARLKELHDASGLKAVWQELDKYGW